MARIIHIDPKTITTLDELIKNFPVFLNKGEIRGEINRDTNEINLDVTLYFDYLFRFYQLLAENPKFTSATLSLSLILLKILLSTDTLTKKYLEEENIQIPYFNNGENTSITKLIYHMNFALIDLAPTVGVEDRLIQESFAYAILTGIPQLIQKYQEHFIMRYYHNGTSIGASFLSLSKLLDLRYNIGNVNYGEDILVSDLLPIMYDWLKKNKVLIDSEEKRYIYLFISLLLTTDNIPMFGWDLHFQSPLLDKLDLHDIELQLEKEIRTQNLSLNTSTIYNNLQPLTLALKFEFSKSTIRGLLRREPLNPEAQIYLNMEIYESIRTLNGDVLDCQSSFFGKKAPPGNSNKSSRKCSP